MKASSAAVLIVGVLVFLAGAVFALQGDGIVGGSVMTGNPFWIYVGIPLAIIGLLIAFGGLWTSSRQKMPTSKQISP
jgi:hypothetical protein